MSEVKNKDWVVEFGIDYPAQTFHVKRVTEIHDMQQMADVADPLVWVLAADELGAFSQGSNVMRHLGFTSARDA